jgi:hypothetical protein
LANGMRVPGGVGAGRKMHRGHACPGWRFTREYNRRVNFALEPFSRSFGSVGLYNFHMYLLIFIS